MLIILKVCVLFLQVDLKDYMFSGLKDVTVGKHLGKWQDNNFSFKTVRTVISIFLIILLLLLLMTVLTVLFFWDP